MSAFKGLGAEDSFIGIVKRQRVNIGSKSEHEAIVLDTGNGPALKIRVRGNNPFHDSTLEPLIGLRVRIKGVAGSGVAEIFVDKLSDIILLGPPGRPIQRPPQP